MEKKYIGLTMAALLFVACGCAKGPAGAAGPQGPQGTQGTQGSFHPLVLWVSPIPGDADIPLDSVVRAGFSTAMDPSTLNSSTFVVSVGGAQVTGTISYNSGSQTVYFSPGLPLTAFTYCSVVLTTGVKDAQGNALAQNYTWSFTTGGSFAPSRIYLADVGTPSVRVYNNAGGASGNVSPDRNIAGANTLLNWPSGIWLDAASDRLYVISNGSNSIQVFTTASTATGNLAPSRNITGAATTLAFPGGIWLDAVNDRLYVVNNSNSILVFNNAGTINGNVAPTRTIAGGNTTLNAPYGQIWLDSANDRLYVTNTGNNAILVFNNAGTINGNVAPTRTIAGAATTLVQPQGMWLDATSDQIYVAGTGNSSITVFTASTANGNIAPTRTIAGAATTFSGPEWIWLDSATDRLYVVDFPDAILVFNNASTINGNVAPSRTITGANTLIANPRGIWFDRE